MKRDIDQIFELLKAGREERTAIPDSDLTKFMEDSISGIIKHSSYSRRFRRTIFSSAAACVLIVASVTVYFFKHGSTDNYRPNDVYVAASGQQESSPVETVVSATIPASTSLDIQNMIEEAEQPIKVIPMKSAEKSIIATNDSSALATETKLISELKAIGGELPELQLAEITEGMDDIMELLAENLSVFEYLPLETIFGDNYSQDKPDYQQ